LRVIADPIHSSLIDVQFPPFLNPDRGFHPAPAGVSLREKGKDKGEVSQLVEGTLRDNFSSSAAKRIRPRAAAVTRMEAAGNRNAAATRPHLERESAHSHGS